MVKKEEEEIKKEIESEGKKISDLPGIGPASVKKLEDAGIYDLMGLAVMSPPELSEIAGIGEAVARKAIQASRKMMDLGFTDGVEFAKKREEVKHITTGSKNLDNLLGGKGVETKAITEAYGAYGSGKCVSKDTEVCYFNDMRMHVESIEETYNKYKEKEGEQCFEEGYSVPVSTVRVLAWLNGKMKIIKASYLYKEKVKNLMVIKTKRGRILRITGKHQLLGFDGGLSWKKAELLNLGDLIACPRELDLETENIYDEDDAYFLGLFVAEGTHNPFSLTICEEKIKDWVCNYIFKKFGYAPTVRVDKRGNIPKYVILFRNSSRVIMDNLDKCNSSTKFIPEAIFLSNKNVVLSFLGGYFDGDAEVSDYDISATTKSVRLASQLTYLLLRLGVCATIRDKIAGVKKEKYKVVRISGEDREKLKDIKFKLKKFSCVVKNSSYGYSRKIVSFISELYKESIGGNRGRLRKVVGKENTQRTAYSNLIGNSNAKVINSSTLDKIEQVFLTQKEMFLDFIKRLEENFSIELLKEIYPKLPFAFNSLSENMGVCKKTMQNYYSRKIPLTKIEILKNLIVNELKTRVDTICLALEVINEIRMFSWDIIESIKVIDYDDYVYDFVVPEGHSFIGGNIPTMMHNTQLGLQLAVNVQLPIDKGGANGKAVYIDTEGTFRPERIKQIAEGIQAAPDKVLKNIFVARAFNSLPASEKVYILNDKEFHKETIGEVVNNRKNNQILTFAFEPDTGKMKPTIVTNLISHSLQKGQLFYTIKTKFGREITVTGSHSLFKGVRKGKNKDTVRREKGNMRPEVVEACSLKEGDCIAIPKFLPMIEKDIKTFDIPELINRFPEEIRNEIKISEDTISLIHTGKHEASLLPKIIEVDSDLLWLLGFFIAEGNAQFKHRLVRVRLTSETEYLKKAMEIINKKFVLNAHLHEKFHSLLVSSRLFSLILRHIFEIRVDKKSGEREIPSWIMQLPLAKLKYFLKGFWDGDGYHAKNRRMNRLIFHTSSKELSNDLTIALLRFGILASVFEIDLTTRKDYKDIWNKHYRVEAAGLSHSDIFNLENIKQNLNAPVWNDLVFANINSIQKKVNENEVKVYDFEVFSENKPCQNFLGGFGGVCCHNSDHQILLLDKITEMIKNGEPIKLVVIDSLTAHFRAEFAGRGQLADRQQKLNKYLHSLMKLAEQCNLAVYVTNQVMANPAMMFGDPTTAVGGNIVGHACLTGDSLIQISDGSIKEIKEMKQEEIISANFSKLKLGNSSSEIVFINPDVKNVYNIKTNNQVNCSGLHRFFTINNFSIVEKEAKDLNVGDFVMQVGKIEIVGEEQKLPLINVKRIGKLKQEDAEIIKNELKKEDISRKEICKKIGITPRQFRRVLNQSYPTGMDTLNKIRDCFAGRMQLQLVPIETYKHRNLSMPVQMTSELAQICGYFLGDGNFESRGLRFRDARAEVLGCYSSLFNKIFNISGSITKMNNKNCFTLSINSQEIVEMFKLVIPRIFDYIGKSKNDVVRAFIKGFVDAEGHIDKKRAMISVCQKEKSILRYLQLFLLRFEIRSTIKFDIGKKKISVLRIQDRDIVNYLQIGFTARDKQQKLAEQIGKIKSTYKKEMMPIERKEIWNLLKQAGLSPSKIIKARGSDYKWINRQELESAFNILMNIKIQDRQVKQKIDFIFKILNSNLRFEKIREINVSDNKNKELFYDFSVPENQNYVANGFVVHNSTYRMYLRRGKKDSRVAKLIDSPNLPDNETIFFLTTAGIKDGLVAEE